VSSPAGVSKHIQENRFPRRLLAHETARKLALQPCPQPRYLMDEGGKAMRRATGTAVLLALALGAQAGAGSAAGQAVPAQHPSPGPGTGAAPLPDEVRALGDRAIANQHRNDAANREYERLERHYVREGPHVLEDRTFRVVPTGTGTLKLLAKEGDKPVDPAFYRKQLQAWEQVLAIAVNPNDPRERDSEERAQRKAQDRAEMVAAVRQAFRFTWLGRETRGGRTLLKLAMDPNPTFQPRSRSAELLTHARAVIWIDESQAQLVRGEAEIIRDISFGGGVLGKIYRGGRFVMEQEEVAPGIWLPTLYQYDFEGRKFLFGFAVHETTEISHYHRDGPPKDALVLVRSELANGRGFSADP
jgi:hypothetical protein